MVKVLVTGCSTGAGRGMALEFAARGCEVLATARSLSSIQDLAGGNIKIAQVDVTVPKTLIEAVQNFGVIDIAIANAGLSSFSPLIEQELSIIEDVLRTNSVGVVATAKAVAPGMIEQRSGLIIAIGSVSGAMITPYAGAYCASKAAVTALCSALRMELAPFGISVMEVVAGSIKSNFSVNAMKTSTLPESSRYAKLQPYINGRVNASQGDQAVSAETFAKDVADAALSQHPPPSRITAGGAAVKYDRIGRFYPRAMWEARISKAFGIHLLKDDSTTVNTGRQSNPLAATSVGGMLANPTAMFGLGALAVIMAVSFAAMRS